MLVDGGAGLNLISPDVIQRLQIPDGDLEETGAFQGINPGKIQPKGNITLPVTFGTDENYRTEKVIFDVVDNPFAYNGILGRPALSRFMAASHYAYNTLKMASPISVIIVNADKKDALVCTKRLYREAVTAFANKTPTPSTSVLGSTKRKTGKEARQAGPGKRTS
ncbi:hypothetical protein ZWY2020_034592 [Hordeum vulgare]|nr:hypothetical protein ZWY2020_034592 [Hordeum vulgare]